MNELLAFAENRLQKHNSQSSYQMKCGGGSEALNVLSILPLCGMDFSDKRVLTPLSVTEPLTTKLSYSNLPVH